MTKAIGATVCAAGVAVLLAGCGSTTGGQATDGKDDTATVTSSASASDPVPRDFPATVPVIAGKYKKGVSTAVSRNLTVLNVQPAAFDQAQALLLTGNWVVDVDGKPDGTEKGCARAQRFEPKDDPRKIFGVTLCGRPVGSGYEVDYKVIGPGYIPADYDR
ncbi:hypothetical protein [Tsukamurella sp. NPDC003166]|uniref:hypothetical protein n=1 Tax=Tsukamurella sp. NPDC003166 TaxID=3154444 RepID=UPI0033A934F9